MAVGRTPPLDEVIIQTATGTSSLRQSQEELLVDLTPQLAVVEGAGQKQGLDTSLD